MMELDKWQQEVLEHEGNECICTGRQVGKSFIIAKKACQFAIKHPKTITLVIAKSQRQAGFIFEKITGEFIELKRGKKDHLKKRATLTKLELKNGSKIYCYPAGDSGATIRGLTCDYLIGDEADFIKEAVWRAVIPMMAVSQQIREFGWMTLISTIDPWKDTGFFKEKYEDPSWAHWKISAEDCPRIPKDFLLKEKERLPSFEYLAEHCAEWTTMMTQYFSDELVNKCMNFKFWDHKITERNYIGIDLAGMGTDEEAFVCGKLVGNKIINFHNEKLSQSTLQDTVHMTHKLDNKLNFKRIFIDSSGIGEGYLDIMKEKFGRRLVGLNNASKSIDKQKKILKEDLYSNTLRLMEQGLLSLIESKDMRRSLKSIRQKEGKIGGSYSHFAEALVRMCWCLKHKGLNLCVV